MLARAAVLALLASATASLTLIPVASGATAGTRYARCSDPHPKTYETCPDVLTMTDPTSGDFQFMVKKTYCSASVLAPQDPGVWALYGTVTIRKGKISGTRDFNNYIPGAQDVPDDIGVSFRFSGTVVSPHRIRLVLTGTVTNAGASVADCAGVTFTETHILKTVSF
jgi:hypothetical protein